ncbi:c-type heme family protein [Sphaerotilaceae bacterium SBD11-9]
MKLLLKFNLVFLVVFALGLGASSYIARKLLQENAHDEVLDRARLLMESAMAVSTYTSTQVAPLLETQMTYTFLPQSVPAYSASEVLNALRKNHPEYAYKPAMLNPTNPRDRAQDWEEDVIQQFKQSPDTKEFIGQRMTPSGPVTYIARPIKLGGPACLRCHSTVEAAPKPLVEKYGPANGFGWNLNEVLGAQVVSVPMSVPLARADRAFGVVIGLLAGVFLLIGLSLNLMLWKLVIQPVSKLSQLSDRVSLGELDAPEFAVKSKDEIGTLAQSFTRMRKSMVHAMRMLDS